MKRFPLAICLLLVVVGYHCLNALEAEFYHPQHWLKRDVFELKWNEVGIIKFPFPFITEAAQSDAASRRLGEVGAVCQYRAGRLPDFLFRGLEDPYLRLYLREETGPQRAGARSDVALRFGDSFHYFVEQMQAKGVHLIILPVPTKVSIERHYIVGRLPAKSLHSSETLGGGEDPDGVYHAIVEAAPAVTVDLLQVYRRYQNSHPREHLFPPADTHWSSLGMSLAAQAVVAKLVEQGVKSRIPDFEYDNKLVPDYTYGNLQALNLPSDFLESAPEFQWYEPIYQLTAAADKPRRGRLILAGSCHSRRFFNTTYGFGTLLGESLKRQTAEVAMLDAPATAPLRQMVDQGWILYPGDILVWEFGLRNLPGKAEEIPIPYVDPQPQG